MAGRGITPLPRGKGRRTSRGAGNFRGSSQMHRGSSQPIGAQVRVSVEDDSLIHPNLTHHSDTDEEHDDVEHTAVGEDVEENQSRARGQAQAHTKIATGAHEDALFCPNTGKWLEPKLASQLTSAIKDRMKVGDAWPTWGHIPKTARELICEEWMSRFDFNEDDKARAKREFYKVGSEKVRSIMYKAREAAKKKCKASGANHAIKNGKPTFIAEANWVALIEYWMKNDWCAKSQKGSVNRKTLVEGSMATHNGGSVSFVVTKKRLAHEKNRPVQFSEVFDKTHRGPRSTAASETYKEKMKEKYGTDDVTAWPYNDDEVYLESMGKPKKGRYYGLGSNTSLVPLSSQVGSSSQAPINETPASKDEIQSMIRDMTHLKQNMATLLEERDERDVRLMRMIVEAINRRFPHGSQCSATLT